MKISLTNTDLTTTQTTLDDLCKQKTYTILYFYPKDDTPGCTLEAMDFTSLQQIFSEKGIQVVGVSRDSEKSHCSFIEKHSLSPALISDPDLMLHKQFGARGEKNNYGKIVQGVIRSTFLIDSEGTILQERKNVRAKGHAQRILTYCEENL